MRKTLDLLSIDTLIQKQRKCYKKSLCLQEYKGILIYIDTKFPILIKSSERYLEIIKNNMITKSSTLRWSKEWKLQYLQEVMVMDKENPYILDHMEWIWTDVPNE